MRVLVTHPGLQHSNQLAQALYDQKLLCHYMSGTPLIGPGEYPPKWLPSSYARRIRHTPIPAYLRSHPLLFQAKLKAGTHILPQKKRNFFIHSVFHEFDKYSSLMVNKKKPEIVVAYENSALNTLEAAKRISALCILDAPSIHYRTAAKLLNLEDSPQQQRIDAIKQREIDLADYILTCSSLAAETYRENGVAASKLVPILLGSELQSIPPEWKPGEIPRFIFVGRISYRKAIDKIIDAASRLNSEGLKFSFCFVGGVEDTSLLEKIQQAPNLEYIASKAQSELFALYAQSDCLVLPSRFDSFGMVVPEAMSCGTPALVTSKVGAKEIIDRHPSSGWIIQGEDDSLYNKIKYLIQQPEVLHKARPHAKLASCEFTWSAYRYRVGNWFANLERR